MAARSASVPPATRGRWACASAWPRQLHQRARGRDTGRRLMVANAVYVKGAGGCSAPVGVSDAAAMAGMGEMRMKFADGGPDAPRTAPQGDADGAAPELQRHADEPGDAPLHAGALRRRHRGHPRRRSVFAMQSDISLATDPVIDFLLPERLGRPLHRLRHRQPGPALVAGLSGAGAEGDELTARRLIALLAATFLLAGQALAELSLPPEPRGYLQTGVPRCDARHALRRPRLRPARPRCRGGRPGDPDRRRPAPVKPDDFPADRLWLPTHRSIPRQRLAAGGGPRRRPPRPSARRCCSARWPSLTGGDRGRTIVVFCKPECWASWNVGKRLIRAGYTGVAWFPGGVEAGRSTIPPPRSRRCPAGTPARASRP